jgi:hypothetical protein
MHTHKSRAVLVALTLLIALATWRLLPAAKPAGNPDRFEFQIVGETDSKYLGDTPSLTGRVGSVDSSPGIGLGDQVFRGDDELVGTVTSAAWDRAKGAMEVEMSPEPMVRVPVGETVWIKAKTAKGKQD